MSKEADKSKKVSITNIANWITSHTWQSILIALAIFLVPLVIVHFLYKWYTGVWILASTWSSGDLITYIAGFEAFLGTVMLGIVAVRQNERNIDINDRLLKLEEASSTFIRYPYYRVSRFLVEHTSLDKIKDLDTVIYYNKELNKDQMCSQENLSQQFYRFSFYLANVSDYNFTISLQKLVLISLENEKIRIDYNAIALASIDEYFTIAAKQELQLGFIVYDTDLHEYPSFLVQMDLFVSNILDEKFVLSLELLTYVKDNTRIFKKMTEKITKVRYVNQ